MKLLNPKPVEKPMQTMAWRPFFGRPPEGVGDIPKLYDDGYWYVRQAVGAGWYQHRGLPNDPMSTAAMDGEFDPSTVGFPKRSAFGTIAASFNDAPSGQQSQLDDPNQAQLDHDYRAKAIAARNAVKPAVMMGYGYETGPSEDEDAAAWDNKYRTDIIARRQRVTLGAPPTHRILRYGLGDGLGAPDLATAASAMNDALLAHGYKQSDMPLYKAFQQAAGLTADGYPGSNTMMALFDALANIGQLPAPVKLYPWLSGPGYDGVNAPTMAEWSPGSSSNTSTTTTVTKVTPSAPRDWTPWIIGGAVAAGTGIVGYAYYKRHNRGRR
jgi:hypothetical protein